MFKELDQNNLKHLENVLEAFSKAIMHRLGEKYEEGYRGWDDDYDYHKLAIELNKDSIELIKENDPIKASIDIGARAMMLWYRHIEDTDSDVNWSQSGYYSRPKDKADAKQGETP